MNTTTEPLHHALMLCDCSHPHDEHRNVGTVLTGPCSHGCGCTVFHWSGESFRECGHHPDFDPCEKLIDRLHMSRCSQCGSLVEPAAEEPDHAGTFAVYDHCGMTWTQGFDNPPPKVKVKRVEDRGNGIEAWIIDCPFCGREHSHSAETGERASHCHQDDYILVAPTLIRPRKKLPFRAVWDRDDWRCVTCGTHRNLTVDHIVPVSKGGTDEMDNLQTMCKSCNSSKGNRV